MAADSSVTSVAELQGTPPQDDDVLTLRLLGPLELRRGGLAVELGGPLPRALLAVLAAADGRPVSVDRLIDELWGDAAPVSAASSLASYVSRLRGVLDDDVTPSSASVLRREAGGYSLRIPPDRRDTHGFHSELAMARRALGSGDWAAAAAAFSRAQQRWTDDPAPIDELPPGARSAAIRLAEERLEAREGELEARLASGESSSLVGLLEALVAEEPLRETPVMLLGTALYRSGRQTDALEVLRTAVRRFDEQLGVLPRPELRGLEQAILVQDESLDASFQVDGDPVGSTTAGAGAAVPSVTSGASAGASRPAALPVRRAPSVLTRLIGRTSLLDEAVVAVREHRLVTLWGAAGAGKTRLAVELASELSEHRRRNGGGSEAVLAWASLAEVASEELVDAELVTSLGASVQVQPSLRDQLVVAANAAVRSGSTVLLVDNAEHVVSAVGAAVADLLVRCPELRIVVTSRTPLGVAGERLVEVAPLALGPDKGSIDPAAPSQATSAAARLFLDRATAVAPGWLPDELDLVAIDDLCERLDGLPLAVELAAARVRELSPEEILAGLRSGSTDLSVVAAATPHHDSLRSAIAWSHDLLDAQDRTLVQALATFDGDFDLTAAAAVAGGPVIDGAARLSASSLLVSDRTSRPRRYRMLQVVREWLRGATPPLEAHEARRRLTGWAASFAHELSPELWTTASGGALARLERDMANVRGAIAAELSADDGDALAVLSIAIDLVPFWHRSAPDEGIDVLERAVQRARDTGVGDAGLVARGLLATAKLAWVTGRAELGRSRSVEAATLAGGAGEPLVQAVATAARAFMVAASGDPGHADERVVSARTLAERLGGRDRAEALANALVVDAVLADGAGEHAGALASLDEAARFAAVADQWPLVLAVAFYRGRVALRGGRADLAREVASDAAELASSIGVQGDLIEQRLTVAAALVELDRVDDAAQVYTDALSHAAALGVQAGYAEPGFVGHLAERLVSAPGVGPASP